MALIELKWRFNDLALWGWCGGVTFWGGGNGVEPVFASLPCI